MKHQAVNMLTSFRGLSFVIIIWSTNWLGIKNVLQSAPPLFLTGICLLGGAIGMGAVRLCLGNPLQRGCEGKGRLVAVGLLQMAGGLGLGLVGLQYLDVGTSALIFYTMPLWLVTVEWTIDRQMQSLLDVIALTCGMLGLGMLVSGTTPVATSHDILGLALFSMSAFNWALRTWIHKRIPGDLDVWNRTVFQLATSGAIVIVASLLLERRLDWTQLPVLAWPLAFNCIGATGLAFLTWYGALSRMSSQIASQSVVLIPVVALVAAAVLQRETSTTCVVVACVLMSVGVTTAIWRSRAPIPQSTVSRALKPAIGREHHMEPGDVGFDTSLSPDEDRRRGRPCGLDYRRAEPFYRSGHSCGATGTSRARSARLRDRPGIPFQTHKA
ncbi:DMT family transporter [Bradyrhizobium sp. CSA112]|uniref:DMT family transporter n=1 Tax=Bradyrhizobium sp. CSA112 TaxID=2699170 RepID=UPI0023AFF53A|nr:DMT family transporter [Bradyrhizobium sp. CSA112]